MKLLNELWCSVCMWVAKQPKCLNCVIENREEEKKAWNYEFLNELQRIRMSKRTKKGKNKEYQSLLLDEKLQVRKIVLILCVYAAKVLQLWFTKAINHKMVKEWIWYYCYMGNYGVSKTSSLSQL